MAEDILENQSKKGNGLVLVIIIVILLLLLVVGGLLAFLLMGNSEDTAQAQAVQAQTEQVQASTPKNTAGKRSNDYIINMGPVYPLDQFIVNLLSESGSRYLKTKVDLELSAETLTPEIDKKKPLIRDIIVSTLSSKTYEEVSTQKGKNRLKDEIVDRLNEVLADGHIKNIYFTDFVVQ